MSRQNADKLRANRRAPETKEKDGKKKLTSIIIIAFAVLMALSMTLPSLAQIFASHTNQADKQAQTEAAKKKQNAEAGSASQTEAADTTTVDGIMKLYSTDIARHEKALEKDKNSLVELLQCGKTYMEAGGKAASVAKTDDDAKKVVTLFDQAKGYFDRYLALQDAVTVRVDRALCDLYEGNIENGITALKKLTDAAPQDAGSEYGYAYMYLGIAYQAKGDTNSAKAAYQQAQKLDPNDEFGARSMAVTRLAQLTAAEKQQPTTTDSSSATGNNSSRIDNLLSDLKK